MPTSLLFRSLSLRCFCLTTPLNGAQTIALESGQDRWPPRTLLPRCSSSSQTSACLSPRAESSQSSERRAHAELQYPREVLHVRAGLGLPEIRVAGVGDVGAVVLVIEQIEDLHDSVDGHAAGERQPLLQPQVYLMNRFADEGVPRDDRPVRAQAQVTGVRAGAAFIAQVESRSSPEPLAGAAEVDPAHLEAGGDLPDPVDDGPMALVTRIHEPPAALPAGEAIFPAHIG